MTRLILIGLCALSIVLAGLDYRHYAAGRARALERIARHGLDQRFPELRADVGRRYDPVDAELRVARALLNQELDRSWMAGLGEREARAEVERGRERLAEAAAIARAAWPRRSASWQAPMVLGGATYLELYRKRDPRLMAEPDLWERPLLAAQRLAPAETGPIRFLTAAYLGNWASLTDDRRAAATGLMARAFHDRQTYRLLIGDWLRVAPSRSQALALVPERPWAWQILQEIFSDRRDWELYVTARQRWYQSLGADLDRSLDEIRVELEGGELREPRGRLLQVIRQMPRSLEFAPRLERALELLPPGPAGSESARVFGGWLDWALELCLLRECPFEPAALGRLARLASDPPPDQRALAFLVGGDLPRAELLERRFGQAPDESWSRYYLLKAEHLARARRHDAAREALGQVSRSWRSAPRYWLAERELARRRDDPEGVERADAELDRLRRSSWPPSAWAGAGRERHLTLLPSAAASGLLVEIAEAALDGSVLELFWNGRLVEIRRAARTPATIRLELPVSTGLHRLALRLQAGGAVTPGPVALSGPQASLEPS